MAEAPVIVWFRQVMRVTDHPALAAAVATGQPVISLHILDDDAPGQWRPGGARRWWLNHSIAALDAELQNRGNRLILRHGDTVKLIAETAKQQGATTVFATRGYEPFARTLEDNLKTALSDDGIALKRYAGTLLFEPDDIETKSGGPFKVYTPFWRAVSERHPRQPQRAPTSIPAPDRLPRGDKLESWDLLPTKPDWAGGLRETWVPGETAAAEQLTTFLDEAIDDYKTQRDRPDKSGTSRLSPYLANGEISPNACWYAALARGTGSGVETFCRELVWREFSYHLLVHWPDLPTAPFRPEFADFPWSSSRKPLQAWQKGQTGYPIVDAGMRELWHTGWMHNRVRMVTASFLIKHLLIPWQQGEAWFWNTLVDADLANNAANWQWVAGSGADAAPYFRIFNPIKQGETFDPNGDYVRHWVPELAELPTKYIHAPWEAPADVLKKAGITLGSSYPRPLVDHADARKRALAAFAELKSAAE